MSFDLYKYLKQENRSQRLYVDQHPDIYIYDSLIYSLKTKEPITLVEPSVDNPLHKQLCIDATNVLDIYDENKRRIYFETLFKSPGYKGAFDDDVNKQVTMYYKRSIYEYNDLGYLSKTFMFADSLIEDSYVIWEYDFDKDTVIARTYNSKDDSLSNTRLNSISEIKHIIYSPKQ